MPLQTSCANCVHRCNCFYRYLRQAISISFATCLIVLSAGTQLAKAADVCGPGIAGATACGTGPATLGNQSSTNQGVGNPINIITGNKYQHEEDLPALPGVLGIEIVRHYNSAYSTIGTTTGILGRGWKLSYETDLYAIGNTVQIIQADGTRIVFNRDPTNRSLCSTNNPADGTLRINATPRGDEYVWTWANGRVLSFNNMGKLVQIAVPTGEFLSLQHDHKGMLVQVTDPQGRQLRLQYPARQGIGASDKASAGATIAAGGRFRGVMAIESPVGRYAYAYGSALPSSSTAPKTSVLANLTKVVYPGNTGSRLYHYEDAQWPTFLSGVSVTQAGVGNTKLQRIGTYLYDTNGKAILTVKGTPARLQVDSQGKTLQPARLQDNTGIGQLTLDHTTPGRTIVTNSLGQTTVYRHAIINNQYRLLEVLGAGCSECGDTNVRYAHDKLGRLIETMRLNQAGGPVEATRTELDDNGIMLGESTVAYVAGKPQPAQWRTRYAYSSAAALTPVLQISRPSVVPDRERQTRLASNALGQLLSMTETGWAPVTGDDAPTAISKTTTYRYKLINGRSVLVEIDGPLANGVGSSPADSDITRITWDGLGSFMTAVTMPGNFTSKFTYDDAGNIATVSNTDGQQTTFHYDARNRLIKTANDTSIDTTTYDVLGNAVEFSLMDGTTSRPQQRLAYDLGGRVLWRASHLGIVARNRYDTEGHLLEASLESASFKQSQHHAYDKLARLVATIDSAGRGQQFNWDDAGQLASSIDALGRMKRFDYDARGNLETVIEPTGIIGQEAALRFAYDAHGNTIAVVAPNGATTRTITDDFGRAIAVISPDSGQITRQYDAADKVISSTDALGNRADHEYDAAGRLIKQTIISIAGLGPRIRPATGNDQPAPPMVTRWKYQGSRLIALEHAGQREQYDYDERHRLAAKTVNLTLANGTLATYITRYTYDKRDQLASISLPDGSLLHYRRNGQNQVTALERTRLRSPWLSWLLPAQTIVTGIERDIVELKHFTYGNGIEAHYQRSKEGALARIVHRHPKVMLPKMQTADINRALDILVGLTPALAASPDTVASATPVQTAAPAPISATKPPQSLPGALGLPQDPRALMDHRYLWDAQGNLLHTNRRNGADTYAYDAQDQLIITEAIKSGTTGSPTYNRYAYDGTGNRLLAQEGIADQQELQRNTYKASYAAATNRWQGSMDAHKLASYDASGQPQQFGARTYAWNAMGNLAHASENGKQLGTYRYNHRGERISKTTPHSQVNYLYENRKLTTELDAQGRITRQYLYLGDQPIATIDFAGNGNGNPHNSPPTKNFGSEIRQFAIDTFSDITLIFNSWLGKTETIGYLHNNHLGATETVTDVTGQLLWRASYDAFGKVADVIGKRSYLQPLRLPGQYEDAETGLYYNDHRYYDPQRGQYLTPDPLGLLGGLNSYAYAANNPLKNIDPSGLILFAFDGTNNSNPPPGRDDFSNVYKFHEAYNDGRKWYMNGIGRNDEKSRIFTNAFDQYNGNTARARVNYMLSQLDGYMKGTVFQPNQIINIDIVGFSRGAAMARDFTNKVAQRLRKNAYQKSGACVGIRFLGLWDTVAQFGGNGADNVTWQLQIPDEAKNVFQAVAVNEHRYVFPGESINRGIQRGFIGSHADIGGSYGTGDLSDVALNWIYEQAKVSGITMKTWDDAGNEDWGIVSNPLLHDKSRYDEAIPEDRDFCLRVNHEIWANICQKQRKVSPGGLTWRLSQSSNFILRYYEPAIDADGESKIVGVIHMKAYIAWLLKNYGLEIKLSKK